MKISIVSAYYNRLDLFYNTLKSIAKSEIKDFEYIVVDDCSSPENRLEHLVDEFPFLKIIRLEKEDKWYLNPCVPFNIGIKEAKGDIIVLQNPECLHVHDVLKYVAKNIDETNYISMAAFSFGVQLTKELPTFIENNEDLDFIISKLPQSIDSNLVGWYNHSIYRPVHYHFCSALSKSNMLKLNGFDERFAYGVSYDDDEFIFRIRKLGLNLIIANDIVVIHQYHQNFFNMSDVMHHVDRNYKLYNKIIRGEL